MRSDSVALCYVISLANAKGRRTLMKQYAPLNALEWQFFDALDAKHPQSAAQLAQLPDVGPWGEFFSGDKACTLSHFNVMNAFLATDAPYCLILEDDVFLSDDVAQWMSDVSWWPKGADIVRFERWRAPELRLVLGRRASRHLRRDIHPLYSRHSGTAGYVISRAAAQKVLRQTQPNVPIDHLLFNKAISALARDLSVYQVTPGLAQQGNEPPASIPLQSQRRLSRKEPKWRMDLRRGWYESKLWPWYLWLVVTRRAYVTKVLFK